MLNHNRLFFLLIALLAAGCLFQCNLAGAAFFEKKFVVKKDMGNDILCDDYVVRKNDYVTLLLKQRGDIAFRDFPRFLEIFKRLNPNVRDVNIIYPNQRIIIPLKIIAPNSVEGQASGTVTIPVITITNIPKRLRQNWETYELRYGDWISKLISQRFGPYNSKAYKQGMKLFAKMNPDIKDINFVHAGQKVHLPDPAILKKNGYSGYAKAEVRAPAKPSTAEQHPEKTKPVPVVAQVKKPLPVKPVQLTPPPKLTAAIPIPVSAPVSKIKTSEPPPVEPVAMKPKKKIPTLTEINSPPKTAPAAPAKQAPGFADKSVFEKAARITGARFLTSGKYFFPRMSASDFRLDLSVMPVMEFDSGDRVLLAEKGWLTPDETNVIASYWKKAHVLMVRPDLSLDEILNNVITAIAPGGYETMLSFKDGNIAVSVRANYIFTPPGRKQTCCLSLINRPDMKIDDSFSRYLESKKIKVLDWIESPSFSGWAPAPASNGLSYPAVDTVASTSRPAFVRAICADMGWRYQQKVEVSFPYAGFQIKAVMDMISFAPETDLLVDYGDLGGDAVVAIRDTGFDILQLPADKDAEAFIDTLASGTGRVTVSKDPVFWAADRPKIYTPSFKISGDLIEANDAKDKRLLIVSAPVPDELALFLAHRGIRLLLVH